MKLFKMTNGNNVVFFEAYDNGEARHKAINLSDHSKSIRIDEIKERIQFTRVNNDVNGNPRYVVHFLEFITDGDRKNRTEDQIKDPNFIYNLALKRARTIGGRKFHNKQYGGGIVFQSYNTTGLEISILKLKNNGHS